MPSSPHSDDAYISDVERAAQSAAGDEFAEREDDDWGESDGSSQYFPDITILTAEETKAVLSIMPTSEQIQYLTDPDQKPVELAVAVILFLVTLRYPLIAVGSICYPLLSKPLQAAARNAKVVASGYEFSGIWHTRVLRVSVEQQYTVSSAAARGGVEPCLCLVIGDSGFNAFTTEMQVPWSPGCQDIKAGDAVEVLVLSKTLRFDDMQVVRDVYIPTLGRWLCDYPFVTRRAFARVSAEVYASRAAGGGADDWQQW